MGYTTEFYGRFTVTPPLNTYEVEYLKKFNETRRMDREKGPYFVDGSGFFGQGMDSDIRDFNNPPKGQPGLWCKWTPTDDGQYIEWDGAEKFYSSVEWIQYLIDHFLTPGCEVYRLIHSTHPAGRDLLDPRFDYFTFDHHVNGTVNAEGEDAGDIWKIVIKDSVVTTQQPEVTWPENEEEGLW